MKKSEYNSHAILLLIKKCTEKSQTDLNHPGINQTYLDIKGFALDENLPVASDEYLYKIYRLAVGASEKGVEMSMTYEYLKTICQYVRYDEFQVFLDENNIEINESETSVDREVKRRSIEILHRGNPEQRNYWVSRYKLEARVIPVFFGLFPLVLLLSVLVVQSKEMNNLIVLLVAVIFVLASFQLTGWISTQGKKIQDKVFMASDKKGFPTSYFMLYSFKGDYDFGQKQKYREASASFFGIIFPPPEEEQSKESTALSKLNQAAFSVKNNVKSDIIFSSNIRYGKIRNSIPAGLMGALLSLAGLITGIVLTDMWLIILLSISLASYILIYIQLKNYKGLKEAANLYAKYLLEEFLSRV